MVDARSLGVAQRIRALPQHVEDLGHANNGTRVIWAPQGCEQEDVGYDEFWAQLVQHISIKPFDRFEVRGHDHSWRLECTVMGVRRDGVDIHTDKFVHLTPKTEADDDDGFHTIRRDGGEYPFVIIRNSDQRQMAGRHKTKDDARLERSRRNKRSAA